MVQARDLMENAFGACAQGDLAEADRFCRSAIAVDGACFDAYNLRGVMAARQSRYRDGLADFDRALALRPNAAPVLSNRGNALHSLGQFEEALASYDKALRIQPDYPDSLSNRGNTLFALNRPAEALASYDKALAIRSDSASVLSNRGTALFALDRLDEALTGYDKALLLEPNLATCHFNRAMALLLLGRFAEGWPEYEWRRKIWMLQKIDVPEWHGEDLHGKRLLLRAEEPIGDTIQFARFVPFLAALGAKVVLSVPRQLSALLRSLGTEVVSDGERPEVDFQLPLMSVPFVLGLGGAQIPAAIPYLRAEPARVAGWAKRLPEGAFRIGIAWQGNPRRVIDRGRSLPVGAFAPLARTPGVRLISLQMHDGVEQLAQLPAGMRVDRLGEDFDAGSDTFLDTAAVMMHLDLVITCDSAVAHLAGALGRPVWIVLKDVPVDWRWLLDRADSPWYPTARLFRQSRRDDWAEVFFRIAGELALLVAPH